MHSIALLYPILIITAPSEHSPYFSHVSILFVTNLNLIRIACMGMDGKLLTEAGVKIQSVYRVRNITSSPSNPQLPMATEGDIISIFPLVMKC